MDIDVTRTIEQITTLKNAVSVFQTFLESDCDGLSNGLNGQPVRIALMGATSSGKTTLIKRLISGAAGKISSKAETACLVVHSFGPNEKISLSFNAHPEFPSTEISQKFGGFLERYGLKSVFDQETDLVWTAKENSEDKNWDAKRIDDFFDEVNAFGVAFSQITWTHKKRRRGHDILGLIEVCDFPGNGGLAVHDQAIKSILSESIGLNAIVYLIDTSSGEPSEPEREPILQLNDFLKKNTDVQFYWAYEKSPEIEFDFCRQKESVNAVVREQYGIKTWHDYEVLDLRGDESADDDEDLRGRLLMTVLRQHYIKEGEKYRQKNTFGVMSSDKSKNSGRSMLLDKVFSKDGSWDLVKALLDDVSQKNSKFITDHGICMPKESVRSAIMTFLTGEEQYCGGDGGQNVQDEMCGIDKDSAGSSVENSPVTDVLEGDVPTGVKDEDRREAVLVEDDKRDVGENLNTGVNPEEGGADSVEQREVMLQSPENASSKLRKNDVDQKSSCDERFQGPQFVVGMQHPRLSEWRKTVISNAVGWVLKKSVSILPKSVSRSCQGATDREIAMNCARDRMLEIVDKMVDSLVNFKGFDSQKKDLFEKQVWACHPEWHMIGYEAQFYWLVRDQGGVRGAIQGRLRDSLRMNIYNSLTELRKQADEES